MSPASFEAGGAPPCRFYAACPWGSGLWALPNEAGGIPPRRFVCGLPVGRLGCEPASVEAGEFLPAALSCGLLDRQFGRGPASAEALDPFSREAHDSLMEFE